MTTAIQVAPSDEGLNRALDRAIADREDVVLERQGHEAAVLVSLERYQELLEAEKTRTRHRLREALDVVYEATKDIPAEEMDQMIQESIQASRQARRDLDASGS